MCFFGCSDNSKIHAKFKHLVISYRVQSLLLSKKELHLPSSMVCNISSAITIPLLTDLHISPPPLYETMCLLYCKLFISFRSFQAPSSGKFNSFQGRAFWFLSQLESTDPWHWDQTWPPWRLYSPNAPLHLHVETVLFNNVHEGCYIDVVSYLIRSHTILYIL